MQHPNRDLHGLRWLPLALVAALTSLAGLAGFLLPSIGAPS